MVRKVLAVESGRKITAEFKDEAEYNAYCEKVIKDCLDILLSSLSLEEVAKLWEKINQKTESEYHWQNKASIPVSTGARAAHFPIR